MKKNELRLKNVLLLIRQYKTKVGGNFYDLMDAANRDAVISVGSNPAFMFIADRKAGNEWSAEEKANFRFVYNQAIRDAQKAIIDRAYKAIPEAMRTCRLFREYIAKG
jgi:hypothetical protein